MSSSNQNLSLGEAAVQFLTSLSAEKRGAHQQEIHRFVRWFGGEQPLPELTAYEVASYAEQLSSTDTDCDRKMNIIRAFLTHAKKKGWIETGLAVHLKVKQTKKGPASPPRLNPREAVSLTRRGYSELEAELATLRDKSLQLIDDIRRAAADKDFRENAPLAAAREERGHVEGRIMELEATLKSAVIIDDQKKEEPKIGIGDSVTLLDLDSGEELRYTVVSPRELDPSRGMISSVSPIGKAIVGRSPGEVVEIVTPAGKMRCQIKPGE